MSEALNFSHSQTPGNFPSNENNFRFPDFSSSPSRPDDNLTPPSASSPSSSSNSSSLFSRVFGRFWSPETRPTSPSLDDFSYFSSPVLHTSGVIEREIRLPFHCLERKTASERRQRRKEYFVSPSNVPLIPNDPELFYPHGFAVLLEEIFSPSECSTLVSSFREFEKSFQPALIAASTPFYDKNFRHCLRIAVNDAAFAGELERRLRPFLPPRWQGWDLLDVHTEVKCLKYEKGMYFRPHLDGHRGRSNDQKSEDSNEEYEERSLFTAQLYLNDGAIGGETGFLSSKEFSHGEENIRVPPVAGAVLLFEQRLLHEGCEILQGVKYTVRADIMYRRKKKIEEIQWT